MRRRWRCWRSSRWYPELLLIIAGLLSECTPRLRGKYEFSVKVRSSGKNPAADPEFRRPGFLMGKLRRRRWRRLVRKLWHGAPREASRRQPCPDLRRKGDSPVYGLQGARSRGRLFGAPLRRWHKPLQATGFVGDFDQLVPGKGAERRRKPESRFSPAAHRCAGVKKRLIKQAPLSPPPRPASCICCPPAHSPAPWTGDRCWCRVPPRCRD